MLRIVLLAYTAVMLATHLFGRWFIGDMLVRPRRLWSARWLLRLEIGYYVLLAVFWSRHRGSFPLWPAATLGSIHLAAWAAAEFHPALSAEVSWTPRLARLIKEISIFDLAEAGFLVYLALTIFV